MSRTVPKMAIAVPHAMSDRVVSFIQREKGQPLPASPSLFIAFLAY
jgi:hypothetical protein